MYKVVRVPCISRSRRSRDKQVKNGSNEFVNSCASIFTDLLCKNEPAWSRKVAAKGLSRLCLNEAVQKALRAFENCTIVSNSLSFENVIFCFEWCTLYTKKRLRHRVRRDLRHNLYSNLVTIQRMLNEKCKRLVAEVSLREVNKPTTRNRRDANDFVRAKSLAREKPLLAG